jgi:hypothetical protein
MVRRACSSEVLERAKRLVVKARTVDELWQAQAALLPPEFGLTLACWSAGPVSCAGAPSWLADSLRQTAPGRAVAVGENMTREEDATFLAPFFEKARVGGIFVVGEIKQALDVRLGRKVALASAYNRLHRHGCRKLAPDKRQRQADVAAPEAWKKDSPTSSAKSSSR